MKRKVFTMLLAVCMAGGLLGGCGNSTAAVQETAAAAAENGEQMQEQEEQAEVDVEELELYIDFTWYPSDNWEGIIPEEITKATGVTLNVTRSADDGQLGLMVASGELPDLIFCAGDSLNRLSDGTLCYGYNELIEEYGIDWEPDAERVSISRTHNVNTEDENFYTIVQNYSTSGEWAEFDAGIPSIGGIYYRKDIWEGLGSPEMNTTEQIKSVMAMVSEKYPELQVLNAGNSTWRLRGFDNWYGVSNEFVYLEDGTAVYVDTSPAFHEYAKCINEFFRAGYFTEESLALTVETDAQQLANSGQCFMYEWNARTTSLDELNTRLQQNVPDGEWALLPIPDDSEPIIYANAGWAGVFISRNCKNPEAAIRLVSYLNSEEGQRLCLWGREGIDYTLDENAVPQFSEEWAEANRDTATMAAKYNTNYFCTTELQELSLYYSGRTAEELIPFQTNADRIVFYPELSIASPNASTDEGIIYTKIKEARDAEKAKLYTAATPEAFEEAYQEYMALLDKIGVQELNEKYNAKVQEVKESFGF